VVTVQRCRVCGTRATHWTTPRLCLECSSTPLLRAHLDQAATALARIATLPAAAVFSVMDLHGGSYLLRRDDAIRYVGLRASQLAADIAQRGEA
jgi:hypothetical protein